MHELWLFIKGLRASISRSICRPVCCSTYGTSIVSPPRPISLRKRQHLRKKQEVLHRWDTPLADRVPACACRWNRQHDVATMQRACRPQIVLSLNTVSSRTITRRNFLHNDDVASAAAAVEVWLHAWPGALKFGVRRHSIVTAVPHQRQLSHVFVEHVDASNGGDESAELPSNAACPAHRLTNLTPAQNSTSVHNRGITLLKLARPGTRSKEQQNF